MIPWDSLPPALALVAVFALRSVDITLSTLRMLAVLRGRRAVAWLLGFSGSLLFISAISGVLASLDSLGSVLAYALAYATGNLVGVTIERRLAPGSCLLRVFTPGSGQAVAAALYDVGAGATRIPASRRGGGELVLVYAPRREALRLRQTVLAVEPGCSVTLQNVRSLRGGWMG